MKSWQIVKNCYFLRDVSTEIPKITPGVYDIEVTPLGELYLKKKEEQFHFGYKIYGLEDEFIKKVLKTYNSTSGNLGVLLNGIKGTGKTVTAEIIANESKLPIILVGTNYNGLNAFLSDIEQDVVILIDEYEKVFKGNISEDDFDYDHQEDGAHKGQGDSTLLGLMSGTYTTKHRKLFLLTTNRTWINENMLNRPGRVRYLKNFNDLSLAQIKEIIEDCLIDPKFEESIIAFLKPLKIITVDIVKTVISEVNIYNAPAEECCKELNVEFKEDEYTVYEVKPPAKDRVLAQGVRLASIQHLFNPSICRNWRGKHFVAENTVYYLADAPDLKNNIYTVDDEGMSDPNYKKNFKVSIKKESSVHKSFVF